MPSLPSNRSFSKARTPTRAKHRRCTQPQTPQAPRRAKARPSLPSRVTTAPPRHHHPQQRPPCGRHPQSVRRRRPLAKLAQSFSKPFSQRRLSFSSNSPSCAFPCGTLCHLCLASYENVLSSRRQFSVPEAPSRGGGPSSRQKDGSSQGLLAGLCVSLFRGMRPGLGCRHAPADHVQDCRRGRQYGPARGSGRRGAAARPRELVAATHAGSLPARAW